MTIPPKAPRFHIRRAERPAPPPDAVGAGPFDTEDDGFAGMDFRRPEPPPTPPVEPRTDPNPERRPDQPTAAPRPLPSADEGSLAAIAAEGLTGRQLRRARLLAQKQGLSVTSDLDAVRQLRAAGIDPFSRSSMLDMVTPGADQAAAPNMDQGSGQNPTSGRALARLPGDVVQLPQKAKPLSLPSPEDRAESTQAGEILRMQQDIARRRRRRLALLGARLLAFVLLPTFLAGWYFYVIASPMYATRSEFIIQQAGPAAASGMGGLFSGTAFATSQDSIAVQGYLQSPEAMLRLEKDVGFRAHFQDPSIDALQRLPADATQEDAYKVYQRFVKISYDPTEGLIRMEVIAADPEVAASWASQLIAYAEERVDQLTQRLREDQMRDAVTGYEEAQAALAASQRRLIELQERFKVLSSESEAGLILGQVAALEGQLTQERLSLAQMEANQNPNLARMEPVRQRIATLEGEISTLRARLTEGGAGGASLAEVQGELLVAQSDLQTRQMILAQALQSNESARVEANRQVRYLSLAVSPVRPDAPSYPRAFENTAVTLLIMLGIYLMVSMTAAILREQVSA